MPAMVRSQTGSATSSVRDNEVDMPVRYHMDPDRSRFTVQAFAGGLLSFVGHSPTFAVRQFEGELAWEPTGSTTTDLVVIVKAESLELTGSQSPADREEIERRMRQEVLDVAAFPEIRFKADTVATSAQGGGRYQLRIMGSLALHGVTNRETINAELMLFNDGVRLSGEFPLRLSDYRTRPVVALAGAIKLKDELRLSFDIPAWKEAA